MYSDLAPSRVSQEDSQLHCVVKAIKMSQLDRLSDHLTDRGGLVPMGCWARASWDSARHFIRCFEEEPKTGKGGDQGVWGLNKCKKIEG